MLDTTVKYSYNDITIVPNETSIIKSRSEIHFELPIFTAPMSAVVNEYNYLKYLENEITPIIPRSVSIETRIKLMNEGIWVAMSLMEFKEHFIENSKYRSRSNYNICVDIANGHMIYLYELCTKAKLLANDYTLTIMTGNIANPTTIEYISIINREFDETSGGKVIDYIRVGIGGGSGCITSSNTGVHYPMASLINECSKYKNKYSPKIIADGGIRGYSDVIKALALGADYVMIGSLLSQCIESAGVKVYRCKNTKEVYLPCNTDQYTNWRFDGNNWYAYYTEERLESLAKHWGLENLPECYLDEHLLGSLEVIFFGMASADGQKAISGEKTKTSEGITKKLPVLYTLSKWTENMKDYLKSAMSYTGTTTLEKFIKYTKTIVISNNTKNSINT